MNISLLEEALQPHELKLQAQETLGKRLGVKEVDRPTYEKYIIGPVERFDRQRSAFLALEPDNPFGEEFRKAFKARTGHDTFTEPLPYSELEPEDRICQSMRLAGARLCQKYLPETLPWSPPEGGGDGGDREWRPPLFNR